MQIIHNSPQDYHPNSFERDLICIYIYRLYIIPAKFSIHRKTDFASFIFNIYQVTDQIKSSVRMNFSFSGIYVNMHNVHKIYKFNLQ